MQKDRKSHLPELSASGDTLPQQAFAVGKATTIEIEKGIKNVQKASSKVYNEILKEEPDAKEMKEISFDPELKQPFAENVNQVMGARKKYSIEDPSVIIKGISKHISGQKKHLGKESLPKKVKKLWSELNEELQEKNENVYQQESSKRQRQQNKFFKKYIYLLIDLSSKFLSNFFGNPIMLSSSPSLLSRNGPIKAMNIN